MPFQDTYHSRAANLARVCASLFALVLVILFPAAVMAELRGPTDGAYGGLVGEWQIREKETLLKAGTISVRAAGRPNSYFVRFKPQFDIKGYRWVEPRGVAAAGGTHNIKLVTRVTNGPVSRDQQGYLYMGRITDGRGLGRLSIDGKQSMPIMFHRQDIPAKAPPPATDAYASVTCQRTVRLRNEIFAMLKSAGQGREKVNDILIKAGLPVNANQSGYTLAKCATATQQLILYRKELKDAANKPAKPAAPAPAPAPAPQAQLGPACTAVRDGMATITNQGTPQQQRQVRDLLKLAGLSPDNPLAELLCAVVVSRVQQLAANVAGNAPAAPAAPAPNQNPGLLAPVVSGNGWNPGPSGRSISLWKNELGSTFAWQDNGNGRRVLWLWEAGPRDAIAKQRTIRFTGTKQGADVSGTSYFYHDGCGAYPFPVTGTVEAGPAVVLSGLRPRVDASCNVVGSVSQTMRYTFIARAPTAAAYEPPLDTPGVGVWGPSWELHRLPRFETLNVRRGPGTSNAVVAELPETARDILVIGNGCTPNPDTESFTRANVSEQARMVERSWCNISWRSPGGDDVEGWVYGKYLRPTVR